MNKIFTALFLILLVTFGTAEVQIGAKVLTEKNALDLTIKNSLPSIVSQLQNLPLPDYKGQTSLVLIGIVDVDLTNIKVETVSVENVAVSMYSPNRVGVNTLGATLNITLHWNYRQRNWPHMSGTGTAVAIVKRAFLSTEFIFQEDKSKPRLATTKISVELEDLNVQLKGGFAAWFLNILTSLFKGQIRGLAIDGIKEALSKIINQDVNNVIEEIPFTILSEEYRIAFDFHTPYPVSINPKFGIVGVKAHFHPLDKPQTPPFKGIVLPETPINNQMIQISISDILLKSLFWSFYENGQLKILLTDDMIPDEVPLRLNTTSLKSYMPFLYEKFPNRGLEMDISSEIPFLQTKEKAGIFAEVNANVLLHVLNPDGSKTKAFLASLGVSANSAPSLIEYNSGTKFNVTGEIRDFLISLKLIESYIGEIDLSIMEKFLNIIIGRGLIASYNRQLKNGIPLEYEPLFPGFQILKPTFTYFNDYFVVSLDINYKPPRAQLIEFVNKICVNYWNSFFDQLQTLKIEEEDYKELIDLYLHFKKELE